MLNIVIPMAGAGSRFAKAGFAHPKPLIPVFGKPMIQVVIDNLTPACDHRFIFICQRTHVKEYGLREKLARFAPGAELIEIDGLTEGAACTVLKAGNLIDSRNPLMIANSDQYVDTDINQYLAIESGRHLDGLIMTMKATHPKWSFAATDAAGLVTLVAEKDPISDDATVGIYNFAHGADFVLAANQMIAKGLRVNGEFYVAPVYNEMIGRGAKIGIANIGDDQGNGMFGIGTPEDLQLFVDNPKVQAWFK
jgi:NDP-sugar pyrophosphorylase family protein